MAVGTAAIAISASLATGDEAVECFHFDNFIRTLHPSVHWEPLRSGLRLARGNVIVTCNRSSVTILASQPFTWRIGWTRMADGSGYRGRVLQDLSMPVSPDLDPPWGRSLGDHALYADLTVDVVEVTGRALYAQDIATDPLLFSGGRLTPEEERRFRRMRQDLWRLERSRLREGTVLEPWVIIMTHQKVGRVEIEILEEGPRLRYTGNVVIAPDGTATPKRRIRENSFVVLDPVQYRRVRVNKIIGEAYLTTDQAQAEEYARRYGVEGLSWSSRWTEHPNEWLELLRKPGLE